MKCVLEPLGKEGLPTVALANQQIIDEGLKQLHLQAEWFSIHHGQIISFKSRTLYFRHRLLNKSHLTVRHSALATLHDYRRCTLSH